MIDLLNPKKCTGCFACAQRCPKKCIEITLDHEGFSVPTIDSSRCIQCNLCEKVCPQMNPLPLSSNLGAYAARLKDSQILHRSTSGGVFAAAALAVLAEGGVVFGVEMADDGTVRQTYITDAQELPRLQGSKYVQAQTGNCYCEAKQFLEKGRTVLFSGTPCQIAGLYGFLGKSFDNLYTMDIVCHGVPNQELFNAYCRWRSEKWKSPLRHWYFRDKTKDGWAQIDRIELENRTVFIRERLEPYTYSYIKGYCLRQSCYQCPYAAAKRISDITAGDYWGLQNYHPQFYSEEGVCLLLVNSEKGEHLLEKIRDRLHLLPSQIEKMQQYNGGLVHHPEYPQQRICFYSDFKEKPIDRFVKENMNIPFSLAEWCRQWIPHSLRLRIKQLLKGM